ncbi:unnamed protein product [Polarella glacialis]|uniref:Uncharacterized protein n=1 Tax=Polarella glacialis TaxID=89957 RepID=A0A813GW67_POLGL|nr:unnamed protein product [Polarella glacialis]
MENAVATFAAATTTGRRRDRQQNDPSSGALSLPQVTCLLLATTANLRLVKAAAIRTIMFPTDNIYVKAGRAAGTVFSTACKARSGSESLSPPHVSSFTAVLQTVLQDNAASAELKAQVSQILTATSSPATVVTVCKFSKCFDRAATRLEIVVPVTWYTLLESLITLWTTKHGARECQGLAPRGPLERSISAALASTAYLFILFLLFLLLSFFFSFFFALFFFFFLSFPGGLSVIQNCPTSLKNTESEPLIVETLLLAFLSLLLCLWLLLLLLLLFFCCCGLFFLLSNINPVYSFNWQCTALIQGCLAAVRRAEHGTEACAGLRVSPEHKFHCPGPIRSDAICHFPIP